MVTYKICIEYDGASFSGFQLQKNQDMPTVQGCLQETLSLIFNRPVKVYGAGRTDAGVHASGQVIHFTADRKMEPEKLLRALNGLLNRAVSAKSAEIAPEGFHARHMAKARRYIYLLDNSPCPSALMKDRCYWYPVPLNLEMLKKGATMLEGEHDFSLLCKKSAENEKTLRTLQKAEIFSGADFRQENPLNVPLPMAWGIDRMIIFHFYARSFLHSQVRLMVGNLIDLGRGAITLQKFEDIADNRPGARAMGVNVPGRGLYLIGVDY